MMNLKKERNQANQANTFSTTDCLSLSRSRYFSPSLSPLFLPLSLSLSVPPPLSPSLSIRTYCTNNKQNKWFNQPHSVSMLSLNYQVHVAPRTIIYYLFCIFISTTFLVCRSACDRVRFGFWWSEKKKFLSHRKCRHTTNGNDKDHVPSIAVRWNARTERVWTHFTFYQTVNESHFYRTKNVKWRIESR